MEDRKMMAFFQVVGMIATILAITWAMDVLRICEAQGWLP